MSAGRFPQFDPKTDKLPAVQSTKAYREDRCRFQFFSCETPTVYFGDVNSFKYCRKEYEKCLDEGQNFLSRICAWKS